MEVLASVAAKALSPLVRAVRQLHGERVAAQAPLQMCTDLLEGKLKETLRRFRGGNVDDVWWRCVLNEMALKYVAPDFFRNPAVRDWLNLGDVQDGFVAIARANVMGQPADDESEIRKRLAKSYSKQTGEAEHFAKAPIDVVVASLTGGYFALIPQDQQPLAGMIQALNGERVGLRPSLDHTPTWEPLVRKMLGEIAEKELSVILALRMFDLPAAIDRVGALWRRVDGGDLADAPVHVRDSVCYWATRLHARSEATVVEARRMRETLSEREAGGNPRILDALIKEAEGDADGAMQILRDDDDPDGRSVLLGVLMSSRGEAEALAWCGDVNPIVTPTYFTDLGWWNWVLCLAKGNRWDEAAAGLKALASDSGWAPALAMMEGIVNAALLLPAEWKGLALEGLPIYVGIAPSVDAEAKGRHTRALECFAQVDKCLPDLLDSSDRVRQGLAQWDTWLQLMDPDSAGAAVAREALRKRLEDEGKDVRLVALARVFRIEFDDRALRAYLEKRERLGGLGDDDVYAECLLNQRTMSPRDFATYVEERRDRLERVMRMSMMTAMLFEALLKDGQIERAHTLVEKCRGHLDQGSLARMEAALEEKRGGDPRKRLEALSAESGELVDLHNLIEYLKSVEDRAVLEPLVRELFAREPTLDNAFEVVSLLSLPPTDHRSVVEFLKAHPTIPEQSDQMQSALAWGLFHAGRVRDADVINKELLCRRKEQDDLSLDVYIAVATGDWERLAAIVDREWPRRAEYDPELLLMLAHLASQSGQSVERALELARLAAEKAPKDPHVLIGAYVIHVELGRDKGADPGWLATALEHSSEAGPIWQADLQKVVNDWLPRLRDRNEDIERKFLEGALPIALVAGILNTPLSRLLLDEPQAGIRDGRRRRVVPIVSGVHKPVDVQDEWTVGMDVTSIMVLARLGLLEKALSVMGHVKVESDVMGCLFAERVAVRFHQPARVESARRVMKLIAKGRITLVERAIPPARELADEVGRDLAMLLEASRDTEGVAICVMPIYKAKSLMEEPANTSAYDDVILSPADLCAMAHQAGRLDTEQYNGAKAFMASQGQEARAGLSQSILDGPIHLDGLALSYLQLARVLEPMANSSLDLQMLPNVSEEMNAFIEADETGDDLAKTVEGIRDSLRSAMESDKVSLMPRTPERAEKGLESVPSVSSIKALIYGSGDCDALCVDDRYVNSHPISESPDGKLVPVVCVLDVLRFLHSARLINEDQHWTARHRLREAGFAFVPLEAEELLQHLSGAKFEEGRMLESAELRVIRQTVNRFDSLGLLGNEEAQALSEGMALACVEVVRKLWADVSLGAEVARELSTWVWRYLPVTTYLARKGPLAGESPTPLEKSVSRRLGLLLLGPMVDSAERRTAYAKWLERTVIEPLRSASPELVEKAAADIRTMIDGLDAHRELFGGLFLECLPEGLRQRVIEGNPGFAKDCGFISRQILEIKGSVRIVETDLIAAAVKVFDGVEFADLSDLAGVPVKVFRSEGSETICVSWTDAHGEVRQLAVPELALLCESAAERQGALREILGHLGPMASGARALLEDARSRRLTAREMSVVFAEKTTGVAAAQARLAQKIMSGWQANLHDLHDLVPQSRAYWEGFCGPVPHKEDPETYFSRQLVPYRRSLIEADVAAGLDVCCLGALRDDLNPGVWLEAADDETVLKALVSLRAEGSPIALLGVLDIALYRVEDDRFRRIAEQVITVLLDDHLGFPQGYDGYRFFEILVNLLCNRVGLLEGTAKCPGFWRRMCAWMQAGLIARTSLACGALPDIEELEQWCERNLMPTESLRRLADCRVEPLVMGHSPGFGSLRYEVLSRLELIKIRHQRAGRKIPMATEIKAVLSEARGGASGALSVVPGPAEVHLRPSEPVPQDVAERVAESWATRGVAETLTMLVRVSQFFVLDEQDCAKVRDEVELLSQRAWDVKYGDVAAQLHAASIIAAATEDTVIADKVGATVSRFATAGLRCEDVELMVHTLLQAAAVHREEGEWFEWLQDQLGELAVRLPSAPPGNCVQWLFYLLECMGVALPVRFS